MWRMLLTTINNRFCWWRSWCLIGKKINFCSVFFTSPAGFSFRLWLVTKDIILTFEFFFTLQEIQVEKKISVFIFFTFLHSSRNHSEPNFSLMMFWVTWFENYIYINHIDLTKYELSKLNSLGWILGQQIIWLIYIYSTYIEMDKFSEML